MIIYFVRLANTGSFVICVALKAREYLFLFFRYLHKVLGSVRRRWKVGLCGFYSYLCRTVCTMDSTARAGALRLCPRGVLNEESTSLSGCLVRLICAPAILLELLLPGLKTHGHVCTCACFKKKGKVGFLYSAYN